VKALKRRKNNLIRVISGKDCGNSPRNLFLKNFTVAFAKGDKKYIEQNITEVAKWDYIGKEIVTGKDKFLKKLTKSNL